VIGRQDHRLLYPWVRNKRPRVGAITQKEMNTDHRPGRESTDACSPATPLSAGTLAVTDPAPGGGRSPKNAWMGALGRRLVPAVGGDGLVPGIARCLLAALYATALLSGFHDAETAALQIMALVFVMTYAWVLCDWREALRVLFTPDASLWRFPTGWSLFDRFGVAAYRHAVLWLVVPFLCAGLPCRPEWIVPLPLLASVTQRALEKLRQRLHRRRLVRLPSRAGCGAPSAARRGTPSVPGTQFRNSAVTDRVGPGGPHGGGSARASL
jgi:hypothetical protein